MKTQAFLALVTITVLLSLHLTTAIGVTPPRVIIEEALKGTTIDQSIKLVDIKEQDKVRIELSGEAAEWITVENGAEFIADSVEEDIYFSIQVPQSVANGAYDATVQIITEPSTEETGEGVAASVVAGISAHISITVTGNEVKKYIVRRIVIPAIEEGSPLTIIATIKNEGNVIAKPQEVEIDIKNKETKEIITSKKATVKKGVNPFVTGEVIATFTDVNLEEDLYFADVRVYDDGKKIGEERNIPFDVLKPGALKTIAQLRNLSVQDNVKDLAKISGTIQNIGEFPFHTILTVEIYKDGSLVEILQTDESYLNRGEMQEFSVQYNPDQKGTYKAVGYAQYAGKKSNRRETTFEANPSNIFSQVPTTTYLMGVVVLALVIYIIMNKRRNKKPQHAA